MNDIDPRMGTQETEIRHLHDIRKPVHCIIIAKLDCLIVKVSGIVLSKWILKTSNFFSVHWAMGVQAEIIYRNCYPRKCCVMYTHSLLGLKEETKYEGKLQKLSSPDGDPKPL